MNRLIKIHRKETSAMEHVTLALTVFLLLGFSAASLAEEPVRIPSKWRIGDLAVYLLSFPYPSYETKVVNETTGETVTVERPAEVGAVTVTLIVWNATPGNWVAVGVAGEEVRLTREGYYTLTFKPRPGVYHVSVYTKFKVFEEANVRVVPPPPKPFMIPWEEFLRKLREEKEAVIKNLVFASAGGVILGLWLKHKSRIFSHWVLAGLGSLCIPAYLYIMDYYPLFGLSVAGILAYWLSPAFARWLGVLVIREGAGAESVEFWRIPRDDEGYAILGVSPRYWRSGFMLKKPVNLVDPYPISLEIDGDVIETVVAVDVEETDNEIVVHGSSALARALVDRELVERLSRELSDARTELHLLKRAWPLVSTMQIKEIERAFGPKLFEFKTWREVVKEAKKVGRELSELLGSPESTGEGGETGERGQP